MIRIKEIFLPGVFENDVPLFAIALAKEDDRNEN
jgi:hypothetical protein